MTASSASRVEPKIVGIVVKPERGSLFSNGLHQNAVNLYHTINQMPGYIPLMVACDDHLPKENHNLESLYEIVEGIPVHPLGFFYETYQLHVLIMVSVTPSPEDCRRLKKTGTKLVATSYGHKFAMAMEAMAFGDYHKVVYGVRGLPQKSKPAAELHDIMTIL